MKITLKRFSNILYTSDQILEHNIEPVSLSGIDYWSQEARTAKVKLFFDPTLKSLFEGNLRDVKAGFHTLRVFIHLGSDLIFDGVIPEASYEVEYRSRTTQTIEFEIIDIIGLILTMAEERDIRITANNINPIEFISTIIGSVLYPMSYYPVLNPNTDTYSNSDIHFLLTAINNINYPFAYAFYNYNIWRPFQIVNHLLIDSNSLVINHAAETRFGYIYEEGNTYLIYWEWYTRRNQYERKDQFRFRKWRLNYTVKTLVESIDTVNYEPSIILDHYPAPEVYQYAYGLGTYRIDGSRAYYSGSASLQSIDVLPGDYKAKDLLSEFLQLANAVLVVNQNRLEIINRLDYERPVYAISDPLSVSIEKADDTSPNIQPISTASSAWADAANKHYQSVLSQLPYQVTIGLHALQLPMLASTAIPSDQAISHPYNLLRIALDFDGYRIYPTEVSLDIDTSEIEVVGRAQITSIGEPNEETA